MYSTSNISTKYCQFYWIKNKISYWTVSRGNVSLYLSRVIDKESNRVYQTKVDKQPFGSLISCTKRLREWQDKINNALVLWSKHLDYVSQLAASIQLLRSHKKQYGLPSYLLFSLVFFRNNCFLLRWVKTSSR